ncbi:MAG: Na/Pi cotransporter family protein [Paludibacteraceae bacterium]|nr:Na/Pi cotransporter family protein [Paludibacteraceae bacterium]
MNFGLINLFSLLGSVGLFLYGMKLMSEGLQKAAGDRLRNVLAWMTNNRFLGALTGILITALVQSSSATTVMIVSFVNAGLLNLGQSMAVIMGANVGTAITAWMISLFGFKMDIAALAIPLMAFSVPMLFTNKHKLRNWGEFLIGFSFVFLGLEYLKGAVPDLNAHPEMFAALQQYSEMGYLSVLLFYAIGLVLTLVVQASSATFAIALIMCCKGWISFELAGAIILGGNVGTCITPVLASISGNIWAKRAAAGHLLFNILGSIWALLLFRPFMQLVLMISNLNGDPTALAAWTQAHPEETLALTDGTFTGDQAIATQFASLQNNVSFGLAIFHTVYKIINFSIMIWFTKLYVVIVNTLIPTKVHHEDESESHLKYISTGLLSTAELSILQAKKEIVLFGVRVQRMFGMVRDLFHEEHEENFVKEYSRIQKYENISDRMEVEIANYLTKVSDGRLSDESKHQIHMKMRVISEIESVADSCYNLSRTMQRAKEQGLKLTDNMQSNVELMFNLIDSATEQMMTALRQDSLSSTDVNKSQNIENEINNFRSQLKNQNILDVNEGIYSYPLSVVYMDLITEAEKMGDYIVNVVEAIADVKLQFES